MDNENAFNVPKSVKKENEKIEITIEEVIPQGDSLGNKIVNKKKVDQCKYFLYT
jgi:hypothetical protein